MQRTPNIRDVATLAGVSYQTVSRALNDSPSIRPETRARVHAAIEQLGYRPNQAARALGGGRSRTIGVLAAQTSYYGPMTAIHAIELAARDAGYRLTITTIDDGDHEGVDRLLAQSVDAIVVLAPQLHVLDALDAAALGIPVVRLDPAGVAIDQHLGARLAVRHLLELGHERILHVAGPSDWSDAVGRQAGYRAELERAGIHSLPVVAGDWTAASGYRIARELLPERAASDGHPFTAIFAGNDQMALGLAHGARELGLELPRDLSLVGFDDIPESAHFAPPLTTVRQDFAALGRHAVEVVLARLAGAPPEPVLIEPELVVRESTAAR